MSLFRRTDQPRERRSDVVSRNVWETVHRTLSGSGAVSPQSALTHSAVYECVDLIADLVSGMPVHRYRRTADGERVISTRASVIDKPSTEIDPLNWRRVILVCWLLRGYAAGLVPGTAVGQPTGIELVHPDRVGAKRVRADAPPEFYLDNQFIERWPKGPLWVAPGKMMNPGDPFGRSILEFASLDIEMGQRARKFASEFFDGAGIPTGLIKGGDMDNVDAGRRVKQRFMDAMGGKREPIVIGSDWEYEQIQVRPEESQFLETIKANRGMVASYFRVPPELIGAPGGTGMTYTNVEHRGIDLMRFCVGSWVLRMEQTLNPLTASPEYVKLEMDSLLRPDSMTRWKVHETTIRMGVNSVNDVRRLEDMPPIPEGDNYLWPPGRMQLDMPELQDGADSEGSK